MIRSFVIALILWPSTLQSDEVISYLGADVFTIYDGQRHMAKNWDHLFANGYYDYDVKRVSKSKLESYPMGLPLLRFKGLNPAVHGEGNSTIFIVTDGYRHAVPDSDTFSNMGYDKDAINALSQADLEALPIGPSIPKRTTPIIGASNWVVLPFLFFSFLMIYISLISVQFHRRCEGKVTACDTWYKNSRLHFPQHRTDHRTSTSRRPQFQR